MAKQTGVVSLDVNISKGSQDINFRELLQVGQRTLRISIKSDSSLFQCHARIEVWSPQEHKWNFLEHIHYGSMKTANGLHYVQQPVGTKDFAADRDELIRLARLVL